MPSDRLDARIGDPAQDDPAITSATARLKAEFAGHIGPPAVSRVVVRCRRDLAGSPVTALPELVERLARERLLQSVGAPRTRN